VKHWTVQSFHRKKRQLRGLSYRFLPYIWLSDQTQAHNPPYIVLPAIFSTTFTDCYFETLACRGGI
jgi:hypothetical protein